MTSFDTTRSARAAAVRQHRPEKRRNLPEARLTPAANDNARGRRLFSLLREAAATVILGALAAGTFAAGLWAIAVVTP